LNKALEMTRAMKHLLLIQFSFGTQEVFGGGQDEGWLFGVGTVGEKPLFSPSSACFRLLQHFSIENEFISIVADIFGIVLEGKCETYSMQPVTKS